MFCTTLRRRASFSSAIPTLTTASGLGLRESRLGTHDIALPLANEVDPATGNTPCTRHLRLLLLARSCVGDAKIDATLNRVQHFASLTGGQDLAIIFLLQAPPATTFVPAKQLVNGTSNTYGDANGMYAYTSLQATLMGRSDIPYIPILPLATLKSLPELLRKHRAHLSQPVPPRAASKPPMPFDLLQLCTANPPIPQQTAYVLSDLFPNLRELAETCTSISSAPCSSSPSARAAAGLDSSTQDTDMLGTSTKASDASAHRKLKRLRDLVGEQQCIDVVDFWREEWTAE